jgi:16S rRNA (cytosine967-C5)-methyltransferase
MKLHRVLLTAVINGLADVLIHKKQADTTVEQLLSGNKNWGARDRHFIADNIYTVIRFKRLYEFCAGEEVSDVNSIWKILGAKIALDGGADLSRIEEFASIDLAQLTARKAEADKQRRICESVPDWLDKLGEEQLRGEWENEIHALNDKAKFSIRINTLKANKTVVTSVLRNEGVEFEEVPDAPDALMILSKKNFRNFPAYKNGLFEVQDVSSQLVAPMLDAQPGMMVIDGCAGAGGKTLHIAALMKNEGEILAVDVNEKKLEQLPPRALRAGVDIIRPLNAENLTIGAQTKLRSSADRILLDVPCSGLGVLRRKPDAKWTLSLRFINELVEKQATILDLYAPMLKPGGTMVYSTCSVLPMENERQVQSFIDRNAGSFELIAEKKVSAAQSGHDGFYMAALRKKV